jgi:hypothetical protein
MGIEPTIGGPVGHGRPVLSQAESREAAVRRVVSAGRRIRLDHASKIVQSDESIRRCAGAIPSFSRLRETMIGSDESQVRATIAADCAAIVPKLDRRLALWLQSHARPAHRITLARKTDGSVTEDFWLVTDHTGADDANFRVVYDDVVGQYGIECTILNSVCLFIGFRASLMDAVTDIKVFV